MEIVIERVSTNRQKAAARRIRQVIFEDEMGIALDRLDKTDDMNLLAFVGPEGDAVATLSIVETTRDDELHRRCGMGFDNGPRVARYTQLAVLAPYRGMNIPLMLVIEAHRQFVSPGRFDFSWLLFDAQRAGSSFLCRHLGFTPLEPVFQAEYGLCRALIREEGIAAAEEAVQRAERQLARSMRCSYSTGHFFADVVSRV